ncbi:DUF4426 domain-containing protein [Luteimonas gilva]|uniref:DUF4426 domain-containing protein n=1 Tax=Luteimonas gilva TaxID=2572684 RepID=A0A4V5ZQB9_9GAMM|nr:DUF4426 domain-containing protein [Luteimonas gilva]TKR30883.1 DUF4426 domain-containing protein [Luteimonas gilva]
MNQLIRCACLAAFLALSACGGQAPSPVPASAPAGGEAVETVGDAIARANAVQTSALNEAVARQYGIARNDKTVLLLVAVRKGSGGAESAVPARVTATVTGLTGDKRNIEMRELRTSDLLDYVGTVDTSLPETLRFEVDVAIEGNATAKLRFSREFYPR